MSLFKNFFILSIFATLPFTVTSRIADPSQRELAELYLPTEENLVCPKWEYQGRMFTNKTISSVDACYERCFALQSCNFFSYQASTNTCIGCALEDETELVQDNAFSSYKMVSMKTAFDFGYELWNGKGGIGEKCPNDDKYRIVRYDSTPIDECRQYCKENNECAFFNWGEAESKRYLDYCILCKNGDDLQTQYHPGFNAWKVVDGPDIIPTAPPTKENCPGDVTLVHHDGVTLCEGNAISILSQDTTSVTIEFGHTCTIPGSSDYSIDFAFWQYKESTFSEKCYSEQNMSPQEKQQITIECSKLNKIALFDVWVVDDIGKGVLTEGDDAVVPKCCQPDLPTGIAAYRAKYAIKCTSTC